jgi:hypothetical protein
MHRLSACGGQDVAVDLVAPAGRDVAARDLLEVADAHLKRRDDGFDRVVHALHDTTELSK